MKNVFLRLAGKKNLNVPSGNGGTGGIRKVLGTSSLIFLPSGSNELFKPGVTKKCLKNILGRMA